ncbi:hypothetical protein CC86DRAFT_387398 [Ophiobolus disseminans]|uniref:Uncharacterized protein n=1 Tax=Ophiobolus disseminans TaxID=1469910 RepID=A0A6A6ZHM5_9PLEO|nr:hypothetical protein CC86DRAFT_387398 [Ophiobolus disseminans]
MEDNQNPSPTPLPMGTQQPLVAKGLWTASNKHLIIRLPSTGLDLRDAPKNFRFLDLPAEIRNMVSRYVAVGSASSITCKFRWNIRAICGFAIKTKSGHGGFEEQTTAERQNHAVEALHSTDESEWFNVQEHLCEFKSKLECVAVNFTVTFCPVGCCRPLNQCIDYWIVRLKPRSINFTGHRDGDEANLAFAYADNNRLEEPTHITLDDLEVDYGLHSMDPCEPSKWDAWKLPMNSLSIKHSEVDDDEG